MTINELVNNLNITLDNALILASMSVFVYVAVKFMSSIIFGIYKIMTEIVTYFEKRKKSRIVKEDKKNG